MSDIVQRIAARAKESQVALRLRYHIAARSLAKTAEQQKSAPKKVDDFFKEVKEGNPNYSDEQAWATAWSIYCKHENPGSDHCKKPASEYLKEAAGEASISRPAPTAAGEPEHELDEDEWHHWEKRGEYNLNIYNDGRSWSYFMKNPKGGGGGSTSYPSMKAAIAAGMHLRANPEGKDKVWLTILKWDPNKHPDGEYIPGKSAWVDMPKS